MARALGAAVFCRSPNRCIEMNNALVEPLALFSTLDEHKNSAIPILTTKSLISEQLADFSRSRFDGSDAGGDPMTLCVQVLYVHAPHLAQPSGGLGRIALDCQP